MPDNRLERPVPPDLAAGGAVDYPGTASGLRGGRRSLRRDSTARRSLLAESGPETCGPIGRDSGARGLAGPGADKGLLIAGDIRISLAEVELLTIRIRLIVCSIDKAQEIGLDWWKHDRYLAPGTRALAGETEALRRQVRTLERRIALLAARRVPTGCRLARRADRPHGLHRRMSDGH
jgi:Gas vesicle protein